MLEEQTIEETIYDAIRIRMDNIVQEETKKAKMEIERRIKEQVALISMNVANYFDVVQQKRQITITVKKELTE